MQWFQKRKVDNTERSPSKKDRAMSVSTVSSFQVGVPKRMGLVPDHESFCKQRNKENLKEEISKQHVKSAATDLVCPLSLQLPIDAVLGEDGVVYEKYAIEKYLAAAGDEPKVKSPVTGIMMEKKVFPAPLVKSHIEKLIKSGLVQGDLASKWKERLLQRKQMEAMIQKANDGDVEQMVQVGWFYRDGLHGLERDFHSSFQWFEKAHNLGHPVATACLGHFLVKGLGTEQNLQRGTTYLALGAGLGSDYAAYQLGSILATGGAGLPADPAEARRLLEKALGPCKYSNLNEAGRKKAKDKLDKLLLKGDGN